MTREEAYRRAVGLLDALSLLREDKARKCEACETEEFIILERGFRAVADPSEWPYAKPTEELK